MTESIPQYGGVLIYSMNDTPLGFGVCARQMFDMKKLDPTDVVVLNQADIGEYLRIEDE